MDCLKDLDEEALADAIRILLGTEKSGSRLHLKEWFDSWRDGSFTQLADRFCRSHVAGVAGRATLAALRDISYPEKTQNRNNTKYFRSFLDDPDIAVIFDYYRVLRKLEYILRRTLDEAARRVAENGL